MSAITTHVLDTSRGQPAAGVPLRLELEVADGSWKQIGKGTTDVDGRVKGLLPGGFALHGGVYRLVLIRNLFQSKAKLLSRSRRRFHNRDRLRIITYRCF